MKFLVLLISLTVSHLVQAQVYVGAGLGYARYSTEKLDAKDVVAAGARYNFLVGYNFQPLPVALEVFYNMYNLTTDRFYSNEAGEYYVYHAKIKSGGLLGKYFFGNAHARLGFAFHRFNTFLVNSNTGTLAYNQTVATEYGVEGEKNHRGILFGAGYDLPLQFVTPYVVLNSYQLNNTTADIFEIELGLKFKF
jgi:hypothetical protein